MLTAIRHLDLVTPRTRLRIRFALLVLVGVLATPAAASASTTVVKNIPFEATIEGCGQTISLSGTLLGIFTEQALDGDGLLLTFHFQPQGISGTSSTGVRYHATGLTRETTVIVPGGGLTDTYVNRFHIVGTAGAPTFYVKETAHITVTPTGRLAVSFARFSLVCI